MKIKSYIILLLLFFTNICFAISITDRNQIEQENYHNTVKRGVNGVINDSKGTIQYVYNNWGESAGNTSKNYWMDISNGLEFELLSQFNNPYSKDWSLKWHLIPKQVNKTLINIKNVSHADAQNTGLGVEEYARKKAYQ